MSEKFIPLSVPSIKGNAETYIKECLETNFVSSVGPFVTRFEEEFAQKVNTKHAIACASGTAAIHVALQLAGVSRGDDVFVSDFTFIATVNPIIYLNANPILIDASEETWNISHDLVREELKKRLKTNKRLPKAILIAHVLGIPAPAEPFAKLSKKYNIPIIEDAAESLGAYYLNGLYTNRQVGTTGLFGCYSFNGNKIITTGGGGMIVSSDKELANRARHLTTQAKLPGSEYNHDEIGYNYRLSNVAAALGVSQLELLDTFLKKKKEIAKRYDEAFAGLAGITLSPRPSYAETSQWLYTVLIDSSKTGINRQDVQTILAEKGIQSRPIWVPIHSQKPYRDTVCIRGEVSEKLLRQGLSLPCSVILTNAEQNYVIDEFIKAVTSY